MKTTPAEPPGESAAETGAGTDAGAGAGANIGAAGRRIDKWLYFARIVKTRSRAHKLVSETGLRINGARVTKPSGLVRRGDVLTLVAHKKLHVLEVAGLGARRGPAAEARLLYHDLTPAVAEKTRAAGAVTAARPAGSGRPTKRQRRETDAWRQLED